LTKFFNPENEDSSSCRNVGMNLQLYAPHSPKQYTMNHPCRDNLNLTIFESFIAENTLNIFQKLCLSLANGPYVLHFPLRSLCRPGTYVLYVTVN